MGQILQEIYYGNFCEKSKKEGEIRIQNFKKKSIMQNGNMILIGQDDRQYYLYHKQLQKTQKNIKNMYNWINNLYKYSVNVIKYEIKTKSFVCASHVTIKILLEYGNVNLYQLLNQKILHCQQQEEEGIKLETLMDCMKFDMPLELLNFIKFMINVVEQQKEKNKNWIMFHTKNILYQKKNNSFKYFHFFGIQESNCFETFFAPQLEDKQISEKQTVFSMGMVLLSLFLRQDCSDCYNYQNHKFCQSIFQQKIQKMKEKIIIFGLQGIINEESQYVSKFDEDVSELILLMTDKQNQRISFNQVKKRYLLLIRKASLSFGVKNEVKARSKSIVQPFTSKRSTNNKRQSQNIGCFSTKEQMNFQTTYSLIDQSDFFSMKKIKFTEKSQKKCKQNQALRWKKAITIKMKEQKQNITFNSQT